MEVEYGRTFSDCPTIAPRRQWLSWRHLLTRRLLLQVHRMLMVATSVLTCIAFVLPFVYRGGWSRVSLPSNGCFPANLF